jgi:hypothetical protein
MLLGAITSELKKQKQLYPESDDSMAPMKNNEAGGDCRNGSLNSSMVYVEHRTGNQIMNLFIGHRRPLRGPDKVRWWV